METPQELYKKIAEQHYEKHRKGEYKNLPKMYFDICESYHQARLKLIAEEWTDYKYISSLTEVGSTKTISSLIKVSKLEGFKDCLKKLLKVDNQ